MRKGNRLEEMGIKVEKQKQVMCNGKKGAQVRVVSAGAADQSHGQELNLFTLMLHSGLVCGPMSPNCKDCYNIMSLRLELMRCS